MRPAIRCTRLPVHFDIQRSLPGQMLRMAGRLPATYTAAALSRRTAATSTTQIRTAGRPGDFLLLHTITTVAMATTAAIRRPNAGAVPPPEGHFRRFLIEVLAGRAGMALHRVQIGRRPGVALVQAD